MARNESDSKGKLFKFLKLPFRHIAAAIASASSLCSVVRSYLPTPRRLKLDPSNKLHFPYEPGKQVKSAIKIKNTSKSNVAFKFDEQKDQVAVEEILQVVFLDPKQPSPALEKLKQQLDEADAAALKARNKKPSKEAGPKVIGERPAIDEWKERRKIYLAKQQGEVAVESVQGAGLEQEITACKDVV
ncbi:PapD-like superfamily [Sesbania bispinosa]|nr:PapD-like superfamily [Sesbania bispinosa]